MTREAVLLLGGGGFIGAALSRRLAAAGRRVHVVSRHAAVSAVPNVSFHRGALDDVVLLRKLLPVCGTVVHLASETTPGGSAHRPALEAENIRATLALLEWLQAFDAHLIFLSSGGALYGDAAHFPVAEAAPLAPLSYHGAGKAAIEAFLHAFRAQGRRATVLRPANAYGPEQPLRAGFGFIRTLLEQMRIGSALDIWGDGEAVRDFIYVDDVAAACALFVDRPQDSGIYNVGSGEGHSINAVARLAGAVCGRELKLRYRPARPGDV
ncbi:MAG TPA: epimerase, partial [Betaproteobacteria bacterium]|nr:epimerase [Betaproteobacteria bacterium]